MRASKRSDGIDSCVMDDATKREASVVGCTAAA